MVHQEFQTIRNQKEKEREEEKIIDAICVDSIWCLSKNVIVILEEFFEFYTLTRTKKCSFKMAWPKGKPRPKSATKKSDIKEKVKTVAGGDSLVCIHCRERVGFDGSLPAKDYEKHLCKFNKNFIL